MRHNRRHRRGEDGFDVSPMCCSHDFFLALALGYSMVVLGTKWGEYDSCSKPLQLFLFLHYATILFGRAFHISMLYFARANLILRRVMLVFENAIIFPWFVAWTVTGSFWFDESAGCLPETNQYWTFVIWLAISYAGIAVYCCLLCVKWRTIWNLPVRQDQVRHLGFARQEPSPTDGLTEAEIQSIAVKEFQNDDTVQACSICLEDFVEAQGVKSMPTCSHTFHAGCIDAWLSLRNTCPLCRENVLENRSPVPVAALAARPVRGLSASELMAIIDARDAARAHEEFPWIAVTVRRVPEAAEQEQQVAEPLPIVQSGSVQ